MKFLHTSDWHLGKYLNEFSLIEDQRYILEQIGQICLKNQVDVVIIAGDLYDRSVPPAEAVDLFDETLNLWVKTHKIPVLAISGNHDSPERIDFGTKFYEGSNLYIQGKQGKNIKKVRLKDEDGYVNFYLLPFIEPIKIRKILKDEDIKTFQDGYKAILNLKENIINKEERNIMIAHSFFAGSLDTEVIEFSETERNVGGSDWVSSSVFSDYDYVALGHLHAPQKAGGENMRYSGSILKYSLSEATQKKGVYLVDINKKGSVNIEQIPLTPRRDVRNLEGKLESIIENGRSDINNNDYVFAKIEEKSAYDAMSRLRAIYPNIIGLSFLEDNKGNEDSFSKNIGKDRSIEELFFDFFTKMTGEKMSDDEKEIIKKLSKEVEEAKN